MATFLDQDLIPEHVGGVPRRLRIRQLHSCSLVTDHILDNDAEVLGIALRLSKTGSVDTVAFATPTDVFSLDAEAVYETVDGLAELVNYHSCVLVGFNMARIALHLYGRFGEHVQGVDLATLHTLSTRKPQSPAEFASKKLYDGVRRHRIHALWYHHEPRDVCLRAWLSAVLAGTSLVEIDLSERVDTRNLCAAELQCLSKLIMNVELLEAERPTRQENEFENVAVDGDGQVVIRNARFNTRVRPSSQTAVILETSHGDSIFGQAVRSEGKQTGVKVAGGNLRGGIERITVVGREELTNAERARDEFILLLLQGNYRSIANSPFIQALWYPSVTLQTRSNNGNLQDAPTRPGMSFTTLNPSQKGVVLGMLSEDEPLIVAHGPPGTGKTTTIAAALEQWDSCSLPAWVVAQSNVGVKNIARTLIKHHVDFKLIVSKEFYVEWHEHLYEDIEQRLLRSDELSNSELVGTERLLGGSTILLCTISMLSNPALDDCGIYDAVPVERLVVDEASQIDSFEFMHLFHKFRHLEKVCMFGDPKQLPPFGKETAPEMKTIFDFKQLKPSAYFLNTQYRMPIPLGEFISQEVYNSKLKSVHKIDSVSCVRFVDVRRGQEEFVGSSCKNVAEVHAVVDLVKYYYRHLDFCIITPYDAHRAAIAQRLKAENLPWECVYNVDSFQGHEAQFVIVSTVRTTSPGFLRSSNRMNVMLTRCKQGMVLVTNRRFLTDTGRDTLLGKLAQRWAGWSDSWIDPTALSGGHAGLPGFPDRAGPQRLSLRTTVAATPSSARQTHTTESGTRRVVPGAWAGAVTQLDDAPPVKNVRPRSDSSSREGGSFTRRAPTTVNPPGRLKTRIGASEDSSWTHNRVLSESKSSNLRAGTAQILRDMRRLSLGADLGRGAACETVQDPFPALETDGSPTLSMHERRKLMGQWSAGSKACK